MMIHLSDQFLKHLIFDAIESLKRLSVCDKEHLFFDRTFKSCPHPFYQVYTIYSLHNDLSIPNIYTLLSDKKSSMLSLINMFR